MPLNDNTGDEFSSELEDEYTFDAHFPPGTEIGEDEESGPLEIEPDNGSGSFAEDGPIEVAEDQVMMDGEMLGGAAAQDGQSEIGDGNVLDHQYEIGATAAEEGQTEIGADDDDDLDLSPVDGSEIGADAADVMKPFESFMLEGERMGSAAMYGQTEIGAAIVKVVEKARDNRRPPPPMRAVDVDEPSTLDEEDFLSDVVVVGAATTGKDHFPLLSSLLLRAGAASVPRLVRVDTEESYKAFLTERSPEMAELSEKVEKINRRLDEHMADPDAHTADIDLDEDIEDLVHLGGEVEAAQDAKRVELWMPKRFDGLVTAWREGDFVCASLTLPGSDGEVRICTSMEPIRRCVAEMSRHAAEAGVQASTVVGMLPAMGCVLGAGTLLKEMAAAAPAILQRKEAATSQPFIVRIEPKTAPALSALSMLVMECRNGNEQACKEWAKLAKLSPGPVKQAMQEAVRLVKAAG